MYNLLLKISFAMLITIIIIELVQEQSNNSKLVDLNNKFLQMESEYMQE
jgi:hypothetical protein